MPFNHKLLSSLTEGLPPIVMLSYSDTSGGAAKAAMTLFEILYATGVDIHMLVAAKRSRHPGAVEAAPGYYKHTVMNTALRCAAFQGYPGMSKKFEYFSIARSPSALDANSLLRSAGIINLEWVAGLVGFPRCNELLRDKAIVWTLHDMNPFTGGCHYTAGCEKWKNGGCQDCPQLGPATGCDDLAANTFFAKRQGYMGLNITTVSISRWFGDCAKQSILLGQFPNCTIPHGIDLEEFRPIDREKARVELGLPLTRKILCFGADGGTKRCNKGFYLLKEALRQLANEWREERPLLLIFGTNDAMGDLPSGYDCHLLGHLADKASLRRAYNASDVFILPSLQDGLPQTVLEAQACGTPSIGFYGCTGIEDMVLDGITGYHVRHPGLPLAPNGDMTQKDMLAVVPESVADLAEKIKRIVELPPERYAHMRAVCREHAVATYSTSLLAARYLTLYRKLTGLPEIFVPGLAQKNIPASSPTGT